jgi:S-adenosylmethionine:tRNA ribosyltransferase-isomerase
VYARVAGSAAAPTAGLHFTPRLLDGLRASGVNLAFVTLHVGLDTFKPIEADEVEKHAIHTEWCELPDVTASAIHQAKAQGGRVIAVGTTSMRVLESWGRQVMRDESRGMSEGWSGFTNIFIRPGFSFKVADALITNFHLPKSTLLALVGAFMGMGLMKRAYDEAIRERYRFYSFGDAMLIV